MKHFATKKYVLSACFWGILFFVTGTGVWGASSKISFLAGRDYTVAVRSPISLNWNAVPAREALQSLTKTQKIAVFLDRRVDPGLPLSGTYQNRALPVILRDALEKTIPQRSTGNEKTPKRYEVSQIGNVLYVGPTPYTAHLHTLCEQQHEAAQKASARWLKRETLAWGNLAQPREILQKMAKKSKFQIENLELVPHDLWPETKLPSMPLVDRLILILGQFDLTFAFSETDDKTITVVPLELENILIEKSYKKSDTLSEKLELVQQEFPETRIDEGTKISVRAIREVHDFLDASVRASEGIVVGGFATMSTQSERPTRPNSSGGKSKSTSVHQQISGEVRGPFLPVLRQLCVNQGIELDCDADALSKAGIQLDKPVSIQVQNATIEELFVQFAEEAGCQAKLSGNRLTVKPK